MLSLTSVGAATEDHSRAASNRASSKQYVKAIFVIHMFVENKGSRMRAIRSKAIIRKQNIHPNFSQP